MCGALVWYTDSEGHAHTAALDRQHQQGLLTTSHSGIGSLQPPPTTPNYVQSHGTTGNVTAELVTSFASVLYLCGITLPGVAHRKRRWRVVHGRDEGYVVSIPRPQLVGEYFDGAAKIDIHNHHRQGPKGVCLESRKTNRWEIRFWQTFAGFLAVDAYLAYRRFCPGKSACKQTEFLRVLVQELLDNTIGAPPDAPTLRQREVAEAHGQVIHSLVLNKKTPYFVGRLAEAAAAHRREPQCVLRCRVCKRNSHYHCATCSSNTSRPKGIVALCGPKSGRECFLVHQREPTEEEFPQDVLELI